MTRYLDNALRWRPADDPAQTVLTPASILEPVRGVLGNIDLDPATTRDNPTRATRFYALPDHDGLVEPWDAPTVFINPPYGAAREPFVRRAAREAETHGTAIVALVPNTSETTVTQECARSCTSILYIDRRIVFDYADGSRKPATHGSVLLGWNVDLEPLDGDLGFAVAPLARYREHPLRTTLPIAIEAYDIGGRPSGIVRRGTVGLLYYTPENVTRLRVLDLGRDPNAYEVNLMIEALAARYPLALIDPRSSQESKLRRTTDAG